MKTPDFSKKKIVKIHISVNSEELTHFIESTIIKVPIIIEIYYGLCDICIDITSLKLMISMDIL